MTYKLVPHESGKYTVEFENGGCRPATDVEVELFKQREELLEAAKLVLGDASLDEGFTALTEAVRNCEGGAK